MLKDPKVVILCFTIFQVEKIIKGSSLSRYFNYTTVFAFGYVMDKTFFTYCTITKENRRKMTSKE